MRHIATWTLCALVLVTAVFGCARKRTYSTPEGEVTVTERGSGDEAEVTIEGEEGKIEIRGDEKSAKITTEEGTASIEMGKAVTAQEIGIPFYPGAKSAHTAAWKQQGQKQKGALTQVMFTTPDSVDKVKAFYQKRFPKASTSLDATVKDDRVVHMVLDKGDTQRVVQITRKKDAQETQIVLHKSQTTQ